MVNGILNINKPTGKTSFSIVALVKRLSGERRVGHAGTLDPAASGVLPVCLGQGTRVIQFLMDATKSYWAQVELGVTTDTYDADGKITHQEDPSRISPEQVKSALTSFCGVIQQTPPEYSAVKYRGRPLYQWTRAGIKVERRSRPAKIYRLELIDFKPPVVTVEVECGKGTYIRSLAHDLGQVLGCGASLKSLVRLRYGLFDVRDTVSVPQLEEAFRYGYWQRLVYPIDIVLSHWVAMVVSDDTGQVIRNGRPVTLEKYNSSVLSSVENRCRVYTPDGHFIGVLRFNPETAQWQPERVFS
ncbi:tRNA pseudouridine(55) synthase TruB [Chloroflexota bacterium]